MRAGEWSMRRKHLLDIKLVDPYSSFPEAYRNPGARAHPAAQRFAPSRRDPDALAAGGVAAELHHMQLHAAAEVVAAWIGVPARNRMFGVTGIVTRLNVRNVFADSRRGVSRLALGR